MLHFCNHIPNPDFAIIDQTLISQSYTKPWFRNHIPNLDSQSYTKPWFLNHIPNPDFSIIYQTLISQLIKLQNLTTLCLIAAMTRAQRKIRPKSISVLIVLTDSLRPYSIISWTELSDFRLATMTLSRISRGWTFLLWSYGSFKNLIPADLSILW